MTTRRSKIGRLPFTIREDLNNRLMENVPVKDILNWLNSDSDVRHYLEMLFESRYITEQNVSDWRQGGYQEWLTYRSCVESVRDVAEDAARIALTDINAEHLLLSLIATFAQMIKNWGGMEEIAFNRRLIVMQDLIKLALDIRRSEQRDARLQLDRERIDILREKHRDNSPSSYSPSSSYSPRVSSIGIPRGPSPAHPLHPKAPAIRRPPAPIDPNAYPDDPDGPPQPPEGYKSGPSLEDPPDASEVAAVAAGHASAHTKPGNTESVGLGRINLD